MRYWCTQFLSDYYVLSFILNLGLSVFERVRSGFSMTSKDFSIRLFYLTINKVFTLVKLNYVSVY
jgi:hypothetical protein